jgi:hypothetical protein
VITRCVNAGGSAIRVDWTWPGTTNPDSFRVKFAHHPPPDITVAGTARTATLGELNNFNDTFHIVAVQGGVEGPPSANYRVSGAGGNKTCTRVP